MGTTKSNAYTKEQIETANLLKALAHPARVAIVQYLLRVDSCICNDIVNEINLAQPTISQHLSELKKVDLIQGSFEGKSICYCLNKEVFSKIGRYFMGISIQIEKQNC